MLVTLMLLCTTALRHCQRWWDDAPCPVDRAMVCQIDVQTGAHKPYATGLRNSTALAIQPGTGQLWAVVNERDEIGTNLVPEYLTSVQEGGFYGWPYSYWGQNVDPRVQP
jgi:glucose/arabinose dehydrogenase